MEVELILKMMECIDLLQKKVDNALESARLDVDRTHCRIQDDTLNKWESAIVAMETVVAPYKKWALEWEAQRAKDFGPK